MNETIKELTSTEMKALGKNDREFKEYLNESLSMEGENYIRSHATIVHMRLYGKAPRIDLFEDILSVYQPSDRRFRFALKVLAAKSPHVWGFDGVVWRLKAGKLSKAE